jgi:multiple sugar transport system ATP-binding protein
MDEPLSNLDAKLRVQMRTEIIKLHKQLGVTTIYVTHDQTEAMTMGNRIVVMKDGIIQQVDTPSQIYNNPANTFVAGFVGSPPMNFIEGKLLEQEGRLEFHTNRFALEIPAGKAVLLRQKRLENKVVTLGVRPENMSVEPIVFEAFPRAVIPGIHLLSELMGADQYLFLDIGGKTNVIVRTNPRNVYEEEARIEVAVDMSKALFFDRDSGERLID